MKPTTLAIVLLSLTVLAGCASQCPTSIQPVATKPVPAPAPAAWAMVPVAQPSYHDRLDSLFSPSSTTQTPTPGPKPNTSSATSASSSNSK